MFSPDGRWVAYQSNESGRNEVYVAAFPGAGGKRQISTTDGARPRMWSEKQLGTSGGRMNVDLAPDGKRIVTLMLVETEEGQKAQSHVIFLENFVDDVRRKVPAGKRQAGQGSRCTLPDHS